MDQIEASGQTSPGLGGLRSLTLFNSGDSEGALKAAEEALQRDPDNDLAGQVKAYIESKGKVKGDGLGLKAPDFGASGLGEGGDSWAKAEAVPAGGEWMWGMDGRATEAGKTAGHAKAAGPSDALVRSSMDKFRVGDLNGALLDATRALQADKSDLRSRAIRASISNRQKNYDGAAWEAGEILKLEPKSVPALLERGFAHYGLVQYDAALQDLDAALKLSPRDSSAHVYRGMVLEKMGRQADAVSEYETASRIDPATARFLEDARSRMGEGPGKSAGWKKLAAWGVPIALAFVLIIAGLWARGAGEAAAARAAATEAVSQATMLQTSAPTVAQAGGTVGPGSLLAGSYRIERELGKGGMGVVYEAMDVKLQRPVAIKHMNREAYGSPEMRERFLKEARLVAKLRHPNLAEIFAVTGEEDLYLVFELVQGEALDKTISRKGKLSLDEVKRVVTEVCAALEYAHDEHVIHRDLKPANVMFDKDGRAKVMDFGIAHESRGQSDMTKTAAWGTPPYMAPEQEGGRVGRESDLYALAVMVYEMLTGCRPFPGPYFLEKKLKKQFPPATAVAGTLPKSVDAFFAKALEPEPEKRFRTAAEFAREFQRLS